MSLNNLYKTPQSVRFVSLTVCFTFCLFPSPDLISYLRCYSRVRILFTTFHLFLFFSHPSFLLLCTLVGIHFRAFPLYFPFIFFPMEAYEILIYIILWLQCFVQT
jgi:hypothetical protein